MLQKLYIHNFRCLENFELPIKNMPSVLLIGKNGAGKSTISFVLEIFQNIGRGVNRIGTLVQEKDFSHNRIDFPMRFELEVLLEEKLYQYTLALELPKDFKELRIFEEKLIVSGTPVYTRQGAEVTLHKTQAKFMVDWHLVALPIIQVGSALNPPNIFKTWLAHMIILAPVPSMMTGESNKESLEPKRDGTNFAEWFSGLLSRYPAAYTKIIEYLKQVMPDILDCQRELISNVAKAINIRFQQNNTNLQLHFEDLSDGEKCFFLCAVVLASNQAYGPLFCFWDEPDNYLSISEVGHFIMSLRQTFKDNGQLLIASHNAEAIEKFPQEKILILHRKSHFEPTLVTFIDKTEMKGDLIDALICDDIKL